MLLIVDGIIEAKEAEKPTWGLKTSLTLALNCIQPDTLCASFFPPEESVEVALQTLRGFFLSPSPHHFFLINHHLQTVSLLVLWLRHRHNFIYLHKI